MKRLNLVGNRFGRLIVVSPSEIKRYRMSWNCLCDCGAHRDVFTESLRSGHTKSCGCFRRDFRRNPNRQFEQVLLTYKRDARNRGFEWSLTKDEFKKLTQSSCFYCGSLPQNCSKSYMPGEDFQYSGIDRTDNLTGYVLSNCVPCCLTCNYMKGKKSAENFISHCKKVAGYCR